MIQSSKYSDLITHLSKGDICVFETDTVVGIACAIFLQNNYTKINYNINNIFNIKKRDKDKKFPWLISNEKMLNSYTIDYPDYAKEIISKSWPGNTTLILKANSNCPKDLCTFNKKNVASLAFRIPDSEDLINAIEYINSPLVCTSANISQQEPPLHIKDVNQEILNMVDFVYTKSLQKSKNKKASTIINCTGSSPKTLRA